MARFIKSASTFSDWINDQTTEFVFIGRSNVGKSSLINALAKQKLAITSKTPGRTQLANFYDFKTFRIVDLPGYGYAKVSKHQKTNLIDIIDQVIAYRKNVYGVLQICDANVLTTEDVEMYQHLTKKFVNVYLILNKADKYSLKNYESHRNQIANYFKAEPSLITFISAKKNLNINKVDGLLKQLNKI